MEIKIKPLTTKRISSKVLIDVIKAGLENEAAYQIKEFDKPTRTWNDKPNFGYSINQSKNKLTMSIGGYGKGVEKFIWLDQGTKIRWALMSYDWRSKTKVGSFRSGKGRGRVVIAGKRAMQKRNIKPRPGIKGREWVYYIAKSRKRKFPMELQKMVNNAAKNVVK